LIRWLARLALLMVLAFGLVLALVPDLVLDDPGETRSWRVYTPERGFQPFEVAAAGLDAPVRVFVYLTVNGRFQPERQRPALTLTMSGDGRTVIAAPLDFTLYPPLVESPQAREAIYRDFAGTIDALGAESYLGIVGEGELEGLDIVAVDVTLESMGARTDDTARIVGYGLLGLAVFGLILSFRRRRENPNSKPPPKWGRG
jgi:MYXO-CTERM domain-containing protein